MSITTDETRADTDGMAYVPYSPDAEDVEFSAMPVGQRVRVRPGMLRAGRKGTVICWGRGTRADEQFRQNQASAKAEGRELTDDDYEPLIDCEGPVVAFDDGETHWFPGQGMGAITTVGPAAA